VMDGCRECRCRKNDAGQSDRGEKPFHVTSPSGSYALGRV
jgi:hypothetical protein